MGGWVDGWMDGQLPAVFVPEADRVTQFMYDDPVRGTVWAERDLLNFGALSTDV